MSSSIPSYKARPPKSICSGKYHLYHKIGQGAFAKVRLAMTSDGKKYACKQYYRCTVDRKIRNGMGRLQAEMALVSGLPENEWVVEYVEMVDEGDKVFVVMELCEGGSLEQWLQRRTTVDWVAIKSILKDLFSALAFIHGQNIVHHDVKLGNLLLTGNGRLKLSDFGVAERGVRLASSLQCTSPFGTPAYQSPQVLSGGQYDGTAADMWAAGICVYQVLYGRLPWFHETVYLVMKEITECEGVHLAAIDDPLAMDLCQRLLQIDPTHRLNAKEACEHPYFKPARVSFCSNQ